MLKWRKIPVFSSEWFDFWQIPLLFIINHVPVMSKDLRQALGIPGSYEQALITRISDNFFECYNGSEKRIGVYYSKRPFAYNLFLNYKAFWNMLHNWDSGIANRIPTLKWANVGFDTLTAFTVSGSDTYSDGKVGNSGSNWSAVRSASSGNTYSDSAVQQTVDAFLNSTIFYITRLFFAFNTSGISAEREIVSAKLTMYVNYTPTTNVNHVVPSNFGGGALSNAKFSNITFSSKGSLTISSSGSKDFILDNSLITKAGTSQMAIIMDKDLDNTAPTTGNISTYYYMADNGTNKPCLTVEHKLPSTGSQMLI